LRTSASKKIFAISVLEGRKGCKAASSNLSPRYREAVSLLEGVRVLGGPSYVGGRPRLCTSVRQQSCYRIFGLQMRMIRFEELRVGPAKPLRRESASSSFRDW